MSAGGRPWVLPMPHLRAGGRSSVRYRCECGYVTGFCYLGFGENAAQHELRVHLVVEHGLTALGRAGRCQTCNTPTDDFCAVADALGDPVWLCHEHAPAMPSIVGQAGAGDSGPRFT